MASGNRVSKKPGFAYPGVFGNYDASYIVWPIPVSPTARPRLPVCALGGISIFCSTTGSIAASTNTVGSIVALEEGN